MLWSVFRRLGPALALFVIVNARRRCWRAVSCRWALTATLFPVFLALAATAPPRIVTALVIAFAAGRDRAALFSPGGRYFET